MTAWLLAFNATLAMSLVVGKVSVQYAQV